MPARKGVGSVGRDGGGYHAAVPGQRQDREDAQQSAGSGSGRRGRWQPRRAVPPEPPAQGRLLQPGAGSGELVAMETAGGRVRGADPRRGPQAPDQPLSGIHCLKEQLGKKGVRSGDRRVGIREPPSVLGKEQPYFG